MSKEHYRNLIAYKRKEIVSLRKKITDINDDKKKKSEYYSRVIKNTSAKSVKESHRKLKISLVSDAKNKIDKIKSTIESKKKDIEILKKKLANA